MPPKQRDATALGDTQDFKKALHTTVPPAAFIWPYTYLSRNARRAASTVFPNLISWYRRSKKLLACFTDVFSSQNGQARKIVEVKIGVRIKPVSIEKLPIENSFLVSSPEGG